MSQMEINSYKLKSYILAILYLGIFFGNVIIAILLIINIAQEPFYFTFLLIFQIYTPLTISLGPIFYRYIFRRSHLILDLEKTRKFLISVFDIEEENTAKYLDEKPQAKYLRINLKNVGKKLAKNCSIKMFIYYDDFEQIHEPSNLYPAGHHHFKKKGELPPLIDIAAGDSQIFDICISANHKTDPKFIQFEDYVSLTQKTAKLLKLTLKTYYIELFVYSDNNPPIRKVYKIFIYDSSSEPDWSKINIKEDKEEEFKNQQKIKKKNQTIPPKSEINEREQKNIQYEGDYKEQKDIYTTGASK